MTTARALSFSAITAGALVMLTSPGALAQTESSPDGVRLVWSRGPEASSCSDATEVEADVVRRLGWNPFSPSAQRSIEGHVTRENGAWTATIEERDAQGEKAGSRVVTSTAESCASLGAAAGLAIALIVRSGAVSPPAPPPPAPPPPPPPPSCPECPKPPPPADDARRSTWFAAAVGALGVLPKAAVGASLGGLVPLSHSLSVSATLTYLPDVHTTAPVGDFAFGATFGTLGACYNVDPGDEVRMSGCGFVALGATHVTVYDPIPVRPGAHLFSAALVGPRLFWQFAAPVELVVGADVLLPLGRSAFVVENAGSTETVFEEPAVGALFTLGLGFAP